MKNLTLLGAVLIVVGVIALFFGHFSFTETKPVLKYYGKSITHKIDSTQTPVQVLCDILDPIKNL